MTYKGIHDSKRFLPGVIGIKGQDNLTKIQMMDSSGLWVTGGFSDNSFGVGLKSSEIIFLNGTKRLLEDSLQERVVAHCMVEHQGKVNRWNKFSVQKGKDSFRCGRDTPH